MDNSDIHYEGWLIKSPPTKRIWRAVSMTTTPSYLRIHPKKKDNVYRYFNVPKYSSGE